MSLLLRRIAYLRALAPLQRRNLLACALLLPLFWLGLRLLGLRRWRRLVLHGLGAPGRRAAPPVDVQDLAASLRTASRCWPPANCLTRSLVLEWLLRRRGVAAELRIGVRRDGATLQAHAWVELEGVPVNDEPDIARRFAPLPRISPSALPTLP